MPVPYTVRFETGDGSVAIHISVDERVEGEYVNADDFLRDVLVGFEDTFGVSWDHAIELGTSNTSPELVLSMAGTDADLVKLIGLSGNFSSTFRGFIEDAVERAHEAAVERHREVIRSGVRPKIVRALCEQFEDGCAEHFDHSVCKVIERAGAGDGSGDE